LNTAAAQCGGQNTYTGELAMNQVDTGHYDVIAGEQITLTVEAHKVAENLAVSLDGNTLAKTSNNPATYVFLIAAGAGAHFIDTNCHFSSLDPDDAYFQFFVQSSSGGGPFNASSVRKQEDDWEAVLQFTLP
jgi:hypothetical protein